MVGYVMVRDVSKAIGHEPVLVDVSFDVGRGSVVGLEGVNGSGKTMAMRVLCGLVKPDSGTVSVDGRLIGRDLSFPSSVGMLIEGPALLDSYSGLRNLELLAMIKGEADRAALERALVRVGLDVSDRRPCRKYSLGMRQRLGIAMAIMEAPDLLVLDEPTNALDEDGVGMLTRIVREERERGAAVLVSSHDHDFLSTVCDVTYHMSGGRTLPGVGGEVAGDHVDK